MSVTRGVPEVDDKVLDDNLDRIGIWKHQRLVDA